jgi:hypothetical protein
LQSFAISKKARSATLPKKSVTRDRRIKGSQTNQKKSIVVPGEIGSLPAKSTNERLQKKTR